MSLNKRSNIDSIIFGTLLGDGYCSPSGTVEFTRAYRDHEYVSWLYKEVESISKSPPKHVIRYDKRTKKNFEISTFYTLPLFRNYRRLFYIYDPELDNEIKRVPKYEILKDRLDVLAFTIWYLDDGGKANGMNNGAFLTLDSFTPEEVAIIQKVILENFDIKTNYQKAGRSKSGKLQHRIYIGSKEYTKFYNLLNPIVSQIPSIKKRKLTAPVARKKNPVTTLF